LKEVILIQQIPYIVLYHIVKAFLITLQIIVLIIVKFF